LVVGVSESNCISVFYRQPDGNLPSSPSHSFALEGRPIAVGTIDSFNSGDLQIVVLERRTGPLESDHLRIFNFTGESSFVETVDVVVSDDPRDVAIGYLAGDSHPDIAVVCEGPDPGNENGVVEIRRGPLFSSHIIFEGGRGCTALTQADFNNDGKSDIAVCNLLDSNLMVFYQPFDYGMPPNMTMTVEGQPTNLASGDLSGDGLSDLAVVTQDPAALRVFYQSLGGSSEWSLSSEEDFVVLLGSEPSTVSCGDLDDDLLQDLVVLSNVSNSATVLYQGTSNPTRWSLDRSSELPTGAGPRNALIAPLHAGDHADLAICSARADWSGSSIALYLGGQDGFSNSNRTSWVPAPSNASALGVGDINNDGTEDLVLIYPDENMFRYSLSFSGLAYEHLLDDVPGLVLVEDLNSDGYDDILVADAAGLTVTVHFGSASAETGLNQVLLVASNNITAVEIGDVTGDGVPDLVIATDNGELDVFVNTGSVSEPFDSALTLLTASGGGILAIAIDDFDSDGLADLAFTNTSRSRCSIDILLQGSHGPGISLPCDIVLELNVASHFDRIWPGDVTGDWRSDLSAMRPGSPEFYIFDQLNFETSVGPNDILDLPEVPAFVGVFDATDDDRCDLLVTYAAADLLFLHEQEGESLPVTPSMAFVTGAFPNHALMGDGTGDGRADLLVNDAGSHSVSAWEPQAYDYGAVAGFVLSPDPPVEGEPFSFISTTYSYDPIVEWNWTLTHPGGATEKWSLNASEMQGLQFDSLDNGSYSMALWVEERDGDTDLFELGFDILDSGPDVVLVPVPAEDWYMEFQAINFTASVQGYDPAVGYEWDFRAEGVEFVPDRITAVNYTVYEYNWSGSFRASVRVTDSDGSRVTASVQIEVRDTAIDVAFEDYISVERNPNQTSEVTFDASELATAFPDIVTSSWEFGDGTSTTKPGPPREPISHLYDPTRDYQVNLTVTDDDLNSYVMSTQLLLTHPTIVLVSPEDGAVITPGEQLQFVIRDDSLPLVSVKYSVDEDDFIDFDTLYEIGTEGWDDKTYSIVVRAEDKDGNVAVTATPITVTVDSIDPVAAIAWSEEVVYGGDKVDIVVDVVDENLGPQSVVLHIRYPGAGEFSAVIMAPSAPGSYRATVEIPLRSGTLELYATATDLAGHTSSTDTMSVTVKLHFIDAAWPFLLLAAVLAALGTGAYFFRESKIAVDETFVIYNDGRLISHSTRRLRPGMDDQILGGMLVAIQEFIRDSFKEETSFTLRKLAFGDKNILIEKGKHLHLAVVLHGKESKKVAHRMQHVVESIEREFKEHVADWDGDLDKLRGVNEIVKRLYSKAPGLFRG